MGQIEAKHTPGPWIVSDAGDWSASNDNLGNSCYQGIKSAHGEVVAIAVAFDPCVWESPDSRPNARLIAAAPELLEALAELAGLVDDICAGNYTPDSFTTQPARAALAKAQGDAA